MEMLEAGQSTARGCNRGYDSNYSDDGLMIIIEVNDDGGGGGGDGGGGGNSRGSGEIHTVIIVWSTINN